MSDGFTILVTWPEMRQGKHIQETWHAHVPQQSDAVKKVQEACGALNDAKVEILGTLPHDALVALEIPEGQVRKGRDLD